MKLSCEIIKDLLPLYCDSICSEETKAAVEEHLTDCVSCSEELKKMKSNLPVTLLQKEEGGLIIGGYKMNLIRKFLILSLCVFVLPLLNACFSLIFGNEMFGYSFFITVMVLAANVFVREIKIKNRPAWLLVSLVLFPILMIADSIQFVNGGFFQATFASLQTFIPLYIYFIFSIVMYTANRKEEPLPPSQYKKTVIVFMICETVILLYLGYVSSFIYAAEHRAKFNELTLTAFVLVFVWLGYLFFKRFKRKPLFNTGVCITAFGIFLPTFIAIYEMLRLNPLYSTAAFWHANLLDPRNPANYLLQILIILCLIGAALILIGILTEKTSAQSNLLEQPEHKEEEEQEQEEQKK